MAKSQRRVVMDKLSSSDSSTKLNQITWVASLPSFDF